MSEPRNEGQSLVRDLEPANTFEPRFKNLKMALRYQGSFQLNLRRASRVPAFSKVYQKGDPIRLIDWRAFARTDKLLIREQRDEASTRVFICLDLSDTMLFPDEAVGPYLTDRVPSKLELGIRIGMNLAFMHFKVGDFVNFLLWPSADEVPTNRLLLRSSTDVINQFGRLSSFDFSLEAVQKEAVPLDFSAAKGDLVYTISDGLMDRDFGVFSERFKYFKLIHLLTSLEVDPSWITGDLCYFDESGTKKEFLGSTLLHDNSYNIQIDKWRSSLQEKIKGTGGNYQLVSENTTINDYFNELIF